MDLAHLFEEHLLDHPLVTMAVGGHTLEITKHTAMMLAAAAAMIIVFGVLPRLGGRCCRMLRTLIEMSIEYMRDEVVIPVMGEAGRAYLPYFMTLFFFILIANLLGMVPGGASPTGNIAVTGALACCSLLLIVGSGIRARGCAGYLRSFMPSDVPWWIAPIIIPIEVLGLFIKAFALCVRLFANMIAGHIAILTFIGLIFVLGSVAIAPFALAIDIALSLLEVFVAFLQAYIFTLLTAVFVGFAMQEEH